MATCGTTWNMKKVWFSKGSKSKPFTYVKYWNGDFKKKIPFGVIYTKYILPLTNGTWELSIKRCVDSKKKMFFLHVSWLMVWSS